MNQQQNSIPPSILLPLIPRMNDMSTADLNMTSITKQCYSEVLLNSNERKTMQTRNVNVAHQHQRDREKGERENREDDGKRTRQTNENIDSVTSFTSEQYNCPNGIYSMANYFASSVNSNNISSSNNRHFREYPFITRSSRYRKTHYLDDSDEEIIHDEILEIINLNHYPTLIERWGDDTKTITRHQGEFKIEDYVEFDEIEPTITEEISYEIIYSNNQIKSMREIHHSHFETRNFRKMKKRRVKRKQTRQLLHSAYYNDFSGENTITKTYEIPPMMINGSRASHIDLISEDISAQCLKADEYNEDLLERRNEEIKHESDPSSNDIISRREPPFNESNDNYTKISEREPKSQSPISEVDQETTRDTPIQSTSITDELTSSSIDETNTSLTETDEDLQSSSNSLLSHVIPDSFDENEQPLSNAYSGDFNSSDAEKSEKLTTDQQQASSVESSQPIIQSEELPTSIDHQSPNQLKSIETIPVRDILVTSLPPVDHNTETTEPIKQNVEKPSLNSLIEMTQQITPIPLTSVSKTEDSTVQQTHEDEKQSDVTLDETTVSTDFPATLVNIHLPSAGIKTDTTYTEEEKDAKAITNVIAEVDKQPETISTQSTTTTTTPGDEEELNQQTYVRKNESIPNNSTIEISDTIIPDDGPLSIPSRTEEDGNVELSSDSLADIVRQIITAHLPTADKPIEDFLNGTTEQSTITSIPTTNIEDNALLESPKTEQPLPTPSISGINKSESPVTDINTQTNPKSSVQDNAPNQLDLLSAPIVSQSSSSTNENESLYHVDKDSVLNTDESLQQTTDTNPINQTTTESSYSISKPTNIMNSILTLPTKTLAERLTNIPSQSVTIEPVSSPDAFISGTPTSSETNFNDFHQHRYFPSINIEQADEKKTTLDLMKLYYELQEQRHIQPVIDNVQKEPEPDKSDVNLNNPNGCFDIKSFSLVSNLPSKEYRQVFGVSDEIVNTIDDLTYDVDQKLQSIDTSETPSTTETFEDHQSPISTDQEEHINKAIPSITSDTELDFRYSSLLDRVNTLIQPLVDLPSSTFITGDQSLPLNIKEENDASNGIDVISNIASNSSVTIASEKISSSSNNADTSNEKDIQSPVSTIADQTHSTTESTQSKDEFIPPMVTDNEVIVSKSSEEIAADNDQQASSSNGLFEIIKNLFSSTLLPTTPAETSLESAQPVVNTQEQEETVDKTVHDIDLSNHANNQQEENPAEDQQIQVSTAPLPSSTTKEEEQHGVLDSIVSAISNIKETISNLGSSDEKTAILESPSDVSDKSNDDTQQLAVSDNEKEQPTVIETVEEINDNTSENIVPDQESVIQPPKRPVTSNYPWYASQYKVAATEVDRLSSTHPSSTIDHQLQDETAKKPSCQQLQVINDDYPWYSSHYTILDAEAKFARLYHQLNPPSKAVELQNEALETITTQKYESPKEHDDDEDGFHLVQDDERIPSSTTDEKTVLPTLRPDIGVEPVSLHGYPDAPTPVSPIALPTTSVISKKKHKKKKKDKKEIILFDAPEPPLSDTNKQNIETTQSPTIEEVQRQENMKMNDSVSMDQTLKHEPEELHSVPTIIPEDQKPESSSPSIISNNEELKQVDATTNQSTSSDTSQVLSAPVTTFAEDVKVNTPLIEQRRTDEVPIVQSLPSSIKTTTKPIRTKVIPSLPEEEDNEGFQLVSYRKRILSATKSEQTPPSTSTTVDILASGIDQKTSVMHGQQSSPTSMTTGTQSSPAKKKKNKHKKQKKEVTTSSDIDSSKVEQEPTDPETTLQSQVSSSITKNSNAQSNLTLPSTINTTRIHTKQSTSPEEEEEDNEGFQVVSYRRRITSTSSFTNIPPSSLAKTKYEQNTGRNIDHKRVALHGRHGSASPSIPHSTVITKTSSNQNKQVRPKQDKKQTSLSNTPLRSTSPETHIITSTTADNSFRTPKGLKQKIEQPLATTDKYQQRLKDSKRETTVDEKPKLDQSYSVEQSTNQIVQEQHGSIKAESKTADQQSSVEEIKPSTTMSDSTTDTMKSTLIEDDTDEFKVAGHHKDTPSSPAPTISNQPSFTSVNNDSSSSRAASEIVLLQSTTVQKKPKKLKLNTEDNLPLSTTGLDVTPLSVEETIDQKPNDVIQQVPKPQITPLNNSSHPDEATLTNTTHATTTSQVTEDQTEDAQSQLHSIPSIASSTSAVEEVSTPSNDPSDKIGDLSTAQPVRSTDIPSTTKQIEKEVITIEIPLATSIEPTVNTEEEHVKTTLNKKPAKRRKKKSRTQEKSDDENVLTNAVVITPLYMESAVQKSDDPKPELDETAIQNFKSTDTTTTHTSATFSDERNSKLDLFLPEYMREQINTQQTSLAIPTPSSDHIQKKKSRPKMLKKDPEAKSLLTNEFDNSEKHYNPQTISIDDENINDDDEFIVQTHHSPISNKSEEKPTNNATKETVDNILSRGFYLWLQESQAITQQKDNLTNIIQNIVIQPETTNDIDEDEDSGNASQAIKSPYMTGLHPQKRIHLTNAYFVHHPESMSTPSWLIASSNDNTFQDNPEQFDSDYDEDSMNDQSPRQTDTQSNSTNQSHQPANSPTNDVQQCLGEDFYRQIDHNPTNNFDDWGYFLREKNSYYIGNDLSTSLECFYTRTFDDDTLLSDTLPIHHSIPNERQRYGDFLSSNPNECMTKLPSYKSKPSAYFQNWQKQQYRSIQYQTDDDELFISHSNDGLSRGVRP